MSAFCPTPGCHCSTCRAIRELERRERAAEEAAKGDRSVEEVLAEWDRQAREDEIQSFDVERYR